VICLVDGTKGSCHLAYDALCFVSLLSLVDAPLMGPEPALSEPVNKSARLIAKECSTYGHFMYLINFNAILPGDMEAFV
jgi:hypothetical protein